MSGVFISYRREDTTDASGRIYDYLTARYGKAAIFKDVDNIPYGANFPEFLQRKLRESTIALVMMGPRWINSANPDGTRRLDDPSDFVRVEIETALQLGLVVVPVLVSNVKMPLSEQLPKSLRALTTLNAAQVRPDPDFFVDMNRLCATLDSYVPPLAVSPRPSPVQPQSEPPLASLISSVLQPPTSVQRAYTPTSDTTARSADTTQGAATQLAGANPWRRSVGKSVAIALLVVAVVLLVCVGATIGAIKLGLSNSANAAATQAAGETATARAPTATLNPQYQDTPIITFCNALNIGDTDTAYNQLSTSFQAKASRATFLSVPGIGGQLTHCDASHSSNLECTTDYCFEWLVFVLRGGPQDGNSKPIFLTVIQEHGAWKISAISSSAP
jgi:hypothetical protein